mgnify:CR=1 FL=1
MHQLGIQAQNYAVLTQEEIDEELREQAEDDQTQDEQTPQEQTM